MNGAQASKPVKTLLLGMGNPILTDDAIGVLLAKEIAARLARDSASQPSGTASSLDVVAECSAGGLALLDVVTGYDRLIVLDSIRTAGGRPGDWYRFTAASLRETAHISSIHDANFATILALGRGIGAHVPPDHEIQIFAVEVLENATFGESLSAPLAAAYPLILEEILAEVRGIVAGAESSTPRSSCSGRARSHS